MDKIETRIYINENLIKAEVLPLDTPTFDETLETFSFILKATRTAEPFAPMQKVDVELYNTTTETSEHIYLVIVNDSVETFSLNPLLYKHSITCVQNTRVLSKHLVRNSVFSQPANTYKKSFNAQSQGAIPVAGGSTALSGYGNRYITNVDQASEKLTLTSKEKIKSSYLKISSQMLIADELGHVDGHNWYWEYHTLSEAQALTDSQLSMVGTLLLKYKDAGENNIVETITPADLGYTEFPLNETIKFDRIRDLASQGCNNFEMCFSNYTFFSIDITTPVTIKAVHTWMVQVEIIAETYYNSAYDVLNLLIERQKRQTSTYSSLPLFSLPQSGELYNLLKNTVAPNFTFTQLTLYECVAEVFRLFDAIFTMDENGVLGIEYFNQANDTPLSNPKFAGRTLAIGEDKYTNGLITHYQDAVVQETFPNDKSFARLRSKEFGVPEQSDHSFIVPHPIRNIEECLIQPLEITVELNDSSVYTRKSENCMPIDITRNVLEESIWSQLDVGRVQSDDFFTLIVKQANTIYFAKGDNAIQCGYSVNARFTQTPYYAIDAAIRFNLMRMAGVRAIGQTPSIEVPNINVNTPINGDWKDYLMQLTYKATINGRAQIESITNKYDGETIVDQVNGSVDLNLLGLNMLGLSLKLGEPTLNATHRITTWDKRIKVGDVYLYENSRWIANVCSYTFLNGYIQGKVSFVKNFNGLALRTKVAREKRMSNISNELTIMSEDNYIEYIYYSSYSGEEITKQDICFDFDFLGTCIGASFGEETTDTISFACLQSQNFIVDLYIPLTIYGAGNMICFEMAFESPINAGNVTIVQAGDGWFGSDKYFTKSIFYTDSNGFLDCADFYLTKNIEGVLDGIPVVPSILHTNYAFKIPELRIYKQPNEILALNYEIGFIPLAKEQDFIGSAFINNNFFVNKKWQGRQLYIYYDYTDFKYNILDTKGVGDKVEITEVEHSNQANEITLIVNHLNIATTPKTWAICDENGMILFASNNGGNGTNHSKIIHFFPRHNRLS